MVNVYIHFVPFHNGLIGIIIWKANLLVKVFNFSLICAEKREENGFSESQVVMCEDHFYHSLVPQFDSFNVSRYKSKCKLFTGLVPAMLQI